jgi:hypothetical protein
MKIIALGAYKGTGKSTLAQTLVLLHKFVRYSFADPLYDMVLAGFGIDGRSMTTEQKEEMIPWLGVSFRYLMQTLGTEWGRNTINQEVWLRIMARKLIAAQRAGQSVVIDDARFPNEVKLVQDMGGLVVHMSRADYGIDGHGVGIILKDAHVSEEGIRNLPGVECLLVDRENEPRKLALCMGRAADILIGLCPPTKSL